MPLFTNATMSWNSDELVNLYNYLGSGHFFDRDTMRFFKSRVTSNYRRINDFTAYFITTEKGPSGIRKATIRRAELIRVVGEDGMERQKMEIDTVGEFNELTLAQAKTRLKKLK